jgi:Protein of unknown function (DUF2798)
MTRADFLTLAIMTTGMVFFMTLLMTVLKEGLVLDFHVRWINLFSVALVIVFPIALGMSQIAKKVVSRILKLENTSNEEKVANS